ncbi:MAG: ATP-binding protein [Bacteroidaceae bacterium]|nr:ATP-binding protein [Bacteroidaceae bacterium]
MAEKYLGLKFDADAMVHLLGVQLYDTPLAMLRENVQNAYDAILERMDKEAAFKDGIVKIEVVGDHITIIDNGIGMDEQGLQENYWTAGHSGKNNPESRKAGVVGHFGIGALANFGVCSRLEVNTMRIGTNTRYLCVAERDKMSGTQFPLTIQEDNTGSYGTKISAILMPGITITEEQVEAYITKYVQFIPIPVTINGRTIKQKQLFVNRARPNSESLEGDVKDGVVRFHYDISFLKYQPLKPEILVTNIVYNYESVRGRLFLNKDENEIFGLNNGFGISRVGLASEFYFGGVADFSFLEPTAGRETVSRQSNQYLQQILFAVETEWAKVVSRYEIADTYRDFLVYLNNHFSLELAQKITIGFGESDILLSTVNSQDYAFYPGSNQSTRRSLVSSGVKILFPSQEQPRRSIQLKYLRAKGLEEKKDEIRVTPIDDNVLSSAEFLLVDDIKRVIEDDYIIQDVKVVLAEITMEVNVKVEPNDKGSFTINIAREYEEIKNLLNNRENYSLYKSLIKDFVRVVLYNQFMEYIPKDQKERAAYINEALERRREELSYEYSDVSELREALRKLDNGEITGDEFIIRARKARQENHEEVVRDNQIGDVGSIVKSAADNVEQPAKTTIIQEEQFLYVPQPPILELDEHTSKKILIAKEELATLHGHKLFLAVSPNYNREHRSFMSLAHSTKVIWSTHRIIYIFTDQNNKTSIYYEMALTDQLGERNTGGETLVSTTIITKNSMFVPVPRALYEYFTIEKGKTLKFYVHFEKV